MSYILEQDRQEFTNNNIMKSLDKYKEEIMTLIFEGIQNPVVASALHQHSEEYVTVIMCIISSIIRADEANQFKMTKEITSVIEVVNDCLKIQVNNIKRQLISSDSSLDEVNSISDLNDI